MFVVSFGSKKGYDDIFVSSNLPGYQSRYATTGKWYKTLQTLRQ